MIVKQIERYDIEHSSITDPFLPRVCRVWVRARGRKANYHFSNQLINWVSFYMVRWICLVYWLERDFKTRDSLLYATDDFLSSRSALKLVRLITRSGKIRTRIAKIFKYQRENVLLFVFFLVFFSSSCFAFPLILKDHNSLSHSGVDWSKT